MLTETGEAIAALLLVFGVLVLTIGVGVAAARRR